MKKKALTLNPVSKKTAIFISTILLLVIVAIFSFRLIKGRPYFRLSRISSNYDLGLGEFNQLKGTNIFSLNLKWMHERIISKDSYIKTVKVIRKPPNEVYIEVQKRIPLARTDLGANFLVDTDGALIYAKRNLEEQDLPFLVGLKNRIPYPTRGKVYSNVDEVKIAVTLLNEFRKKPIFKKFRIQEVNVLNLSNTVFFLEGGPQVKIGDNSLKERLAMLEVFLRQFNEDVSKINYIDLRFKEPVVKLNER
ncbi:MAG: cell division protein FtsQ/DivIB [Candidatus Omnitrophota bacterium]